MKQLRMKQIFFLCGVSFILFSCIQQEQTIELDLVDKTQSYNGDADLTVVNVDTKDTVIYCSSNATIKKNGTVYSTSVSVNIYNGRIDTLHLRIGEELKLIFNPPTYFKENQYSVEYQLFDIDTVITNEPYSFSYHIPQDAISHSYDIFCSATSPTWDEDSKCERNVSIVIDH